MKGWILVAAVLAGCGDDADVAGNYTVALTNGTNGCNISNFNPGDTASGIPLVVTQEGSKVTATVEGLGPRLFVEGLLGGGKNVFTGSVDGDEIDVESLGSRTYTTGNCTYTYNATIGGSLDGDVLRGRIEYRAADNGNPDCSAVRGCVTFQDYNGTRPPR